MAFKQRAWRSAGCGRRWQLPMALFCMGGCTGETPATPPRPELVASVTVTPSLTALIVGGDQQFIATLRNADGAVLADRRIDWTTSDSTRARVTPSGLVTGLADGSVRISATSEGRRGDADAVVVTLPVASVAVSPLAVTLRIGAIQLFQAQPLSNTGQVLPGQRLISWASSDETIVRVDAQGVVTAVSAGTALITATCEGRSTEAPITVVP